MVLPGRQSETTVAPNMYLVIVAASVSARQTASWGAAMLTDAWVPAAVGRRVTAAALKKKALYEILMMQGVQFGRRGDLEPAAQLVQPAQYARVGATEQYFEISGARSIVETLSENQASGYAIARDLKAHGFKGCWVIALGSNDTANVYVGSMVGLEARIRRMMRVMGDQPVLWITVKSLLDTGPYSEENMRLWNRTVVEACAKYPNMRVFDWASLAEESWYISDGTHYTSEGYRHRARLSADALAHAFPASGESSDCVVR